MRITGGELRGRHLAHFKGSRIRPTSDRVREAIFSLLGQDLRGVKVLDLFAGTGILGIEALSRGAQGVVFVDHSRESIRLIARNLVLCGYGGLGRVLEKDLTKGLPGRSALMKGGVHLVFADPPYRRGFLPRVLDGLGNGDILESPATVVVEASKEDELPMGPGNLILVKTKIYGDTKICIYTRDGMEL
ncbi:MAG: 16S rRNA (guanine(966)-N(2))-methyltransferase RsmD [Deltaproteobacteria bacterium]|nr:16S rRNA (guanine(966)-N(2))-methyltransferase RsmD [Deltaproteobacteria bacterium]